MLDKYFFSENNFKLIMSVLYEHFKNNENYMVNEEEEGLVINLMKMMFENNSKNPNETLKDYLLRLNRKVLDNAIQIITKELKSERENQKKLNINNNEIVNEYEKIINERNKINEEKKEEVQEKIKEDIEIDNSDVLSSFNKLSMNREEEEKNINEELKNNPSGYIFDNNKFTNKQEYTVINENAPNPTGQDLLIQQPKDFKKLVDDSFKNNNNYVKEYYILIDSRDRNQNDYPNPNDYQIDLNDNYRELLEVKLISSNVPKSQYLINNNNNKLTFIDSNNITHIIQIPIGNYNITELVSQIQTSMNNVGASDTYTVSVNLKTNKITINTTSNFQLIFNGGLEKYNNSERTIYNQNSIGKLLGFLPTDLSGANNYTSQNQYDLNGPTYILLHIDEFFNIEGINSSIQNSFAKIPLDTDQNTYKFFKQSNDYNVETLFSPPLAKLSQLNIRFLNYDGSLYDFGGLEHSFLIKIKTLNQSQGYFIN